MPAICVEVTSLFRMYAGSSGCMNVTAALRIRSQSSRGTSIMEKISRTGSCAAISSTRSACPFGPTSPTMS